MLSLATRVPPPEPTWWGNSLFGSRPLTSTLAPRPTCACTHATSTYTFKPKENLRVLAGGTRLQGQPVLHGTLSQITGIEAGFAGRLSNPASPVEPLSVRTQGPGPAGLQLLPRERPPAGRHRPPPPPAAGSTRAADTQRAGQAPLAPAALAWHAGPGGRPSPHAAVQLRRGTPGW